MRFSAEVLLVEVLLFEVLLDNLGNHKLSFQESLSLFHLVAKGDFIQSVLEWRPQREEGEGTGVVWCMVLCCVVLCCVV